ncbi:hypothetical protein ACK8HX_07835 [Oryzobacter sp. R7]|uniref:hypothetical protein n=1 Tax=Oryzobacter faecalis TaxID=3388656 RepID=UPI00398D3BD8
MTTRAAALLRATALAGALLLASGCAVFSPVQTDYAYQAADGPSLDTGDLRFGNLVVVAAEEGGDGVLVGQAVNESAEAAEVTFALGEGAPTRRTIPASSGGSLSEGGSPVVLSGVPARPGQLVQLTVTTPQSGPNVIQVPVLAPTGYYEQYTVPAAG